MRKEMNFKNAFLTSAFAFVVAMMLGCVEENAVLPSTDNSLNDQSMTETNNWDYVAHDNGVQASLLAADSNRNVHAGETATKNKCVCTEDENTYINQWINQKSCQPQKKQQSSARQV